MSSTYTGILADQYYLKEGQLTDSFYGQTWPVDNSAACVIEKQGNGMKPMGATADKLQLNIRERFGLSSEEDFESKDFESKEAEY